MKKKKRKPATTTRKSRVTAKSIPDPASDQFAYLVAHLAWRDGLTANTIARKLKLEKSPKSLMQVKRALHWAHDRFFKLLPPVSVELAKRLRERVNPGHSERTRFYVVDDAAGSATAAVSSRAADLVVEVLAEMMTATAPAAEPNGGRPSHDIVVCNSGGRTLSAMVRALRQRPPALTDPDEDGSYDPDRLIFVGGNAVYVANEFDRSANFLSVTMAELFGARHLACPHDDDEALLRQYRDLVKRTTLAICAVGTSETGLMARHYFDRHGWVVPQTAVGDLAFNLLDGDGASVDLDDHARALMRRLNPALDLVMLQYVAANGRVILVLDSDPPQSKVAIGTAAIVRGYATDVVLGTSLAKKILNALQSA
jgi:hypothetical protein